MAMAWQFLIVFLLVVGTPALAQSTQRTETVSCPATVRVSASDLSNASRLAAFERISVFNRDKAGREYDLAPDDENRKARIVTQTWNLNDYREMPLFLRCRYRHTARVVDFEIPPGLGHCSQTFELDQHANITGKSTMNCR